MTGHRTTPPTVCSISGGKWHIAMHEPSGYGVWTYCGRGWPESNYHLSRKTDATCKTCIRLHEARQSDV